jgi:hypothetical protein
MDSPMLARVAIVVGALLVLISVFADPLGLGRASGFGWKQILGVVVGALVLLAGGYLWRRQGRQGKVPP